MAYAFTVGNEEFYGITVPGAAWMKVVRKTDEGSEDEVLGSFEAVWDETLGKDSAGKWHFVSEGVEQELLDRITPAVLEQCRRRAIYFLKQHAERGRRCERGLQGGTDCRCHSPDFT